MGTAEDFVRLGMALVIIALVSVGMYSFSSRANAVGPLYGSDFKSRP